MQLQDAEGKAAPSIFYHAHSVDKQDDLTYMIYDNNYNNRCVPGVGHGAAARRRPRTRVPTRPPGPRP